MTTWMEKIFGGDNQVGFFGGGQRRVDPNAFGIPDDQYGAMNFRMAEGGSGVAQDALGQYNPLAAQNEARKQQANILGQQGQLAGNLFAGLNGTQPSVAQQQLNQTTQGNVANQFAMAQANPNNPGAARMAAMNAGNINQQAAGQGAMLRAQEMQNTQGMLGNVLGGMQGSAGGIRGQDLGMYDTLNRTAQGYLGQQMQLQGMQQQGRQAQDAAQQQAFSGAQSSAVGGKIMNAAAGIGGAFAGGGLGGLFGGGGGGGGGGGTTGGVNPYTQMVPANTYQFAHGGDVPSVMGDRICAGCGHLNSECICGSRAQGGTPSPFAHGGAVPSVMGDRICAGCGHLNSECICGSRAQGGLIPGYARGGDRLANDTVSAKLSPGEIVLPRSITKADDAPDKAKAFVEAIRKKHKTKRAA